MKEELDLSKYEGHTPGPWEVNKLPHQTMYACDTFVEPAVAAVWANGPDAELIADAPLLLAEVRRLGEEIRARDEFTYNVLSEVIPYVAVGQHSSQFRIEEAGRLLRQFSSLHQSHARLLAAAKNADCCCGARECEGLRAAVAEAEALR